MDYNKLHKETLKILSQSGDIRAYPPKEQEVLMSLVRLKASLEEYFVEQDKDKMTAEAFDMAADLDNEEQMAKCRQMLQEAFPDSFFNANDEFIAHKATNQYLCLGNCKTPFDVKCKVLEWFSRPAHKSAPYTHNRKNKELHQFMLNGINDFLGTDFTQGDMEEIYIALGNAINHQKTIQFVKSGYDLNVLAKETKENTYEYYH